MIKKAARKQRVLVKARNVRVRSVPRKVPDLDQLVRAVVNLARERAYAERNLKVPEVDERLERPRGETMDLK